MSLYNTRTHRVDSDAMTPNKKTAKPSRTHSDDADIPARLPVLPLVSSVLFPGGVLSLQVGIERNVRLLQSLSDDETLIAAFCQVRGDKDEPQPDDLAEIGVLASIVQRLPLSQDRYQIFLQGRRRIRLRKMIRRSPYFLGSVEPVELIEPKRSVDVKGLMHRSMSLFEKLVESDSRYSGELVNILQMNVSESPDEFADLLATFVNLPLEEKQRLLGVVDPVRRIRELIEHIQRELGRASVDRELQRQIQTSINRRERESYLREQMRIIQDELGELNPPEREVETYRSRVEQLPIPEASREQLLREVSRMAMLSPSSSDYAVIRGHLDTIFLLPWDSSTEDHIQLDEAARMLDDRHYGLEKIKERVLEFLAVLKLKGHPRGQILCFVGPPGVGKTSLGHSIAEAIGRKFLRMSVGGVTDESEIRGHRKTYVGAMPGRVIQAFTQAGVNNPLVLIDELDKIGKDYRGDPAAALLEVLDPEQNQAFVDRYLEIPFDLSRTLFVATANVLESIPGPLRDRMEVIRLSGYTESEKFHIAKQHLIPEQLDQHGLKPGSVVIEDEALLRIIREYTAEAGVRRLVQRIATLMRKTARSVVENRFEGVTTISAANVEDYLGLPQFEHEFAERAPEIGVTTGLAWTSFGGEIMFIEATKMRGNGRTIITGQLGDVMRESVHAAYSYVKSKARELELSQSTFDENDIHLHFPAGAIPKDGPSAGVAIATTIASVLGERPVRHDVAMTGEITLRGKVLSVGGIKEKVMAAERATIRKVLLPVGNKKDLVDVPEEIRSRLEFEFVERVEDVWREALIPLYIVRDAQRKYDEAEYEKDKARERPEVR